MSRPLGESAYARVRAAGVPYSQLSAAINMIQHIAPKRQIPGEGETAWPTIPRDDTLQFLEDLRLAMRAQRRAFYRRLAESWWRTRGEEPQEDA